MSSRHYLYVLELVRSEMATNPTPEEQVILSEHFKCLERLKSEGKLILAGRTEGAEMGLVVFEAETDEAARATMESDPAVKQGVMTATLYPYRLSLFRSPRET